MRGSTAATFVVIFGGAAAAALIYAIRQANKPSLHRETVERLRGEITDLTAHNARLDGENTRLRAENETLKELATGRRDLQELAQEIRTMMWMAYGSQVEEARQRARDLRDATDP